MAADNYTHCVCEFCRVSFEAAKPKRYCTKACNKKAIRQNKTSVPRAEYIARLREASPFNFKCEHCGKDAYRKLSGSNKERDTGNRWCSMACRVESAAADRAVLAERARARSIVLREVQALRRIGKYVERPVLFEHNCKHCSSLMLVKRNGGLHKIVCDDCTAERIKAARRINKLRRNARKRGAEADNIDPIKVFERDKWRCHLCGAKTVKKYRGTYHDRAPELEHIVALSDGGTHTWGNVACACRKCNQTKGAASLGQLGLRFAA